MIGRDAPAAVRAAAKRCWPNGRALGVLIHHYRVIDRIRGWKPTDHASSWDTPVRRTDRGFWPGSRSFNQRYAEMFGELDMDLGTEERYLAHQRWTIACMVKEVRRKRRSHAA
jgi:hypothetical protein